MPELPEVEMARRYLEKTSLHQTIKAARVKDACILNKVSAKHLERCLKGFEFTRAFRHGKRLFLKLHNDLWLALHLGLTGRLIYLQDLDEEPRHTRLLIAFQNGKFLAFDDPRIFGEVSVTRSPNEFLEERNIGPDALQVDRNGFLKIMRGRRGLIKSTLLNQSIMAGLGNLYADEALFRAGIYPKSRKLDAEHLECLFDSIQEVLKTALSIDANFKMLPNSYLLPHRYPGGKCPRDGSPLLHEKIVGRTSYYCPKHQKEVNGETSLRHE